MPAHTLFCCDLCPEEVVQKARGNDGMALVPEGWMACACEVGELVLAPALDDAADAARGLPPSAQNYTASFLQATAQPFTTTFYLCPQCKRVAMAPILAEFERRLRERQETEPPGPAPAWVYEVPGDDSP